MAGADAADWDERYVRRVADQKPVPRPPAGFSERLDLFPKAGTALEVACGSGSAAVWLAKRGLDVLGVDGSPVAIKAARDLAEEHNVADRCHFTVVDLELGLPPSDPVDLILCNRFRDQRLYGPMAERLAPGGLLAVAVLSEVGSQPGRFRAGQGELEAAFSDLDVAFSAEGDGSAVILAFVTGPTGTGRLD